jgi:hypothetical protein
MPTGYEPLYTLKPVATDVWLADGGIIPFYGLPFPTRMVVVRLRDGSLWVHSPIHADERLLAEVRALGPVRHLIAPNWIHYAYFPAWQAAFPDALGWAAPNVAARAAKYGVPARFDRDLGDAPPPEWADELDQVRVDGSRAHVEVVFFHRATRTAILTDLIENFEAKHVAWWHRPLITFAGTRDPDGKAPLDMRWSFVGGMTPLRAAVSRILAWEAERVLLAHGRWYDKDGAAELRRAFRWVG